MPEKIIESHIKRTIDRLDPYTVILKIQDTTDVSFKRDSVEGIGYLKSGREGLKVHSVLATSENGIPLGLLFQKVLSRPKSELGKVKYRSSKRIEDKESYRWLEGFKCKAEDLKDKIQVTIGDRESDIYELFTINRSDNEHYLVRVSQNRLLDHVDRKLFTAMTNAEVKGTLKVDVSRRNGQEAREANLNIKYEKLKIKDPKNSPKKVKSVDLNVISIEEDNPPPEVKAIKWLLITSMEINNLEDALKYVKWYSYRWLIERFHFVLKSGCLIEKLQLEEVKRLERALAIFSIIASKIMLLTYYGRIEPKVSCEKVFEESEWKLLYVLTHDKKNIPKKVPTLKEATYWLAELGGFCNRKSDGEPGAKVLWRGFLKLQNALEPILKLKSIGVSGFELFVGKG